ncbi:MAG: hypothetical protein E7211_08815 [Clostridium lundense]|nr:hypothetical protein [Clostridium lundense]
MVIRDNLKKDDYITIPRLRKFCKESNLGSFLIKEEALVKMEEFCNQSQENQNKINIWLDEIAKEGIKYSYIKKINNIDRLFKSELFWKEFIKTEFKTKKMARLNEATYSNSLDIQFIEYEKGENGVDKVKMNLGLLVYETKKNTEKNLSTDKIVYPIFIEIDINKNIIEIRLKSKSSIRKVKSDFGAYEEKVGDKITTENLADEVIRFLKDKFNFEEESFDTCKDSFYKSYYELLAAQTQTPQIIMDKIQGKANEAKNFAEKIFLDLNLNFNDYFEKANGDLLIWLEKFISLSEPDKSYFTEDRDGYPVKLIATDCEDTRVEESSAKSEPLQMKESYFDHKKILQREKLCDGISMAFKRQDNTYYGNEPFLAIMYYKKGFGVVKFPEYVEEGDIQNVLSRIIGNL